MNRLTKRGSDGIFLNKYNLSVCSGEDFYNLQSILDRLAAYEDTGLQPEHIDSIIEQLLGYLDAEQAGLLIELPCKVGDTVYIIEKCENIDSQLDGTLWNSDGSHGTATGYYCPYEDCCPHDTDDCKMVRDKYAIFKDTVKEIYIYEEDMLILFENCYGRYIKNFGKTVFLTREEAEKALEEQ
jgi:hypothetical protein